MGDGGFLLAAVVRSWWGPNFMLGEWGEWEVSGQGQSHTLRVPRCTGLPSPPVVLLDLVVVGFSLDGLTSHLS
jgi:hypothetical protein